MIGLETPRPSRIRPGAMWPREAAVMPRTIGVRVWTGRMPEAMLTRVVWLGGEATVVVGAPPPPPLAGPERVVAPRLGLGHQRQVLGHGERVGEGQGQAELHTGARTCPE